MNDDSTIPSQLRPTHTFPAPLGPADSARDRETPSSGGNLLKLVLVALVIALVVLLTR